MYKNIRYIYAILLLLGLFSCADNNVAVRSGLENSELTIRHKPGMNVVGYVTVDGKPRSGVVVSDGVNVVVTDEKGEYQMRSVGRQHVFVSVPADCEIPVEKKMPKIYKTLTFTDAVIQMNFDLKAHPKLSKFKLLTLADVQIGDAEDVRRLREEVMGNISSYAQSLSGPVYGISLGDIVWNVPALYPTYIEQVTRTGVPTFSVIGNHDHNEKVKNDTESDKEYRDALGPTYYSCNIGDWHIVALDDILYSGVHGRNDYSGTITQQQLDWLKKDLAYVDKDKSILIGVHIPTSRRTSGTHVSNNKALYDLVKDYHRVEILSGHTHNNFTTTIAPNIRETTFGAVMGAFWNGKICNDGSPRGFAVLEFEGNELTNEYYMGSDTDRNYQIEVYVPGDATFRWGRVNEPIKTPFDARPLVTDMERVLVNVFNWHTDWTVELKEDDGAWTPLTNNAKWLDPEAVRTLQYSNSWEKRPSAEPEENNDHMFVYYPKNQSWKQISVRATDPYGNVYTKTANHPK